MFSYTDQLNRTVSISKKPLRIVSLVPSQTELLYDLGLDEEVVGITKFCVHPETWFKSKTRIGGTKTVDIDKVNALNPTLIIANKEENTESDIAELQKIGPVWISDIRKLDDAYQMIASVGEIVRKTENAQAIINEIKQSFEGIHHIFPFQKVLYVIWNEPIMVAANATFINSVLDHIGLQNAAAEYERYPEISLDDAISLKPDLIFLSSEPFPFSEKHLPYFEEKFLGSRVRLVDGELFSWYGSRLVKSGGYIEGLIKNPKIS